MSISCSIEYIYKEGKVTRAISCIISANKREQWGRPSSHFRCRGLPGIGQWPGVESSLHAWQQEVLAEGKGIHRETEFEQDVSESKEKRQIVTARSVNHDFSMSNWRFSLDMRMIFSVYFLCSRAFEQQITAVKQFAQAQDPIPSFENAVWKTLKQEW